MIIYNQKELKNINKEKGTQPIISYMKQSGYQFREGQQNGDYFEGLFTIQHRYMTVKAYKNEITYLKLV